jgi:hypothetical protein
MSEENKMSSKGEYTMFYILYHDGLGKQGRATSEFFNGPPTIN